MPRAPALSAVLAAAALALALAGCGAVATGSTGSELHVVAAENFWGSIAEQLGGDRLKNVVAVRDSALTVMVEDHSTAEGAGDSDHKGHGMPHAPVGLLSAPGLAEILTRSLGDGDHFCGNEVVAYSPLSSGVKVLPAYTLRHKYAGGELNTRWDDPNCRSSFVGHFSY